MHVNLPHPDVSGVFIIGPRNQTVLVMEPQREDGKRPLWKPPSGKRKFDVGRGGVWEKPWETALRETEEETGLILHPDWMLYLGSKYKPKDYRIHFFVASVKSFSNLRPHGKSGERTLLYPLNRILQNQDQELLGGIEILDDYLDFLRSWRNVPEKTRGCNEECVQGAVQAA
jgi:8-oxo-dGTP pyrophosphatase MutT (NUDIX family)